MKCVRPQNTLGSSTVNCSECCALTEHEFLGCPVDPIDTQGRLIVVSNRIRRDASPGNNSGGLAVAVNAALKLRGGIWMGWSGNTDAEATSTKMTREGNVTYVEVDLTTADVRDYYNGFSNQTLWPLFHSFKDRAVLSEDYEVAYRRVNATFAEILFPLWRPDDAVWVHDYHLIPLAEELRKLGSIGRVGFFLHVPWPKFEVLHDVPVHKLLLKAMSSYDVIGFQTRNDLTNFYEAVNCCNEGGKLENDVVLLFGRRIKLGAYAVSIETLNFAKSAAAAAKQPSMRQMVESLQGQTLIISVDRLDYTKGILERVRAYETFLKGNPSYLRKVTYLQIAPISRSDVLEYQQLQAAVAEAVGKANGAIGTADWTPLRYINSGSSRDELGALFRLARVGFVTPIRDGMNLVAKEYIAAQDAANPGVLIISGFAGAAQELSAGIIVDPRNIQSMAQAIADALEMPLTERKDRWRNMMTWLLEHDINYWTNTYLDDLFS
ncbi:MULTISPECIES: alpha,alpha-trehalose-phosphate synthase (UDP-forming) [Rhizobium]|uniref:Trehalose-6-phosphate synthase protein n=2 Tax=Rhizobium TaxID=379 RepID=Q2K2H1_RHIEC|nr:trehalose-6-phosphate synthase protein [Rhizobium etli CFN 42]NKE92381.1 trehalose-6-phosphate synthase [Rhizobium phaseoli]PDT19057.1 trehalose-6-phosphate synthase [Rhizobium hidalgonense]PON03781.1 trehalose-6-phosphate synthase [Rhizobium hidalgonense]